MSRNIRACDSRSAHQQRIHAPTFAGRLGGFIVAILAFICGTLFYEPSSFADGRQVTEPVNSEVTAQCAASIIKPTVEIAATDPSTSSVQGTPTVLDFGNDAVKEILPPANWSPITATNAELAYYGFPSRPTGVQELAAWNAQWSNFSGVTPISMCTTTTVSHDVNNNIWGGVVDGSGSGYSEAYAHVVQPVTHQDTCSSNNVFSTWVGLGGIGSANLLQNGQDSGTDVPDYAVGPAGGVGAWWEAINAGHDYGVHWIHSGFISPSDHVSLWTHYFPSDQHAVFGWDDYTTGSTVVVTTYNVYADGSGPSISVAYDGGSAEFINEQVGDYDVRPFGTESWSGAFSTRAGDAEDPGHWGYALWRIVHSGNTLLRLDPDALQSDSSWTTKWYGCQ